MKSCSCCGLWRTDAEFYVYNRPGGRTHLSGECRSCKKIRMVENYHARRTREAQQRDRQARAA